MPSKRRVSRPAQSQPQSAQSDYDTDLVNVTDSVAPSLAPPSTRSNTELNLLVLRRYVPSTEAILCIAPFAAVYTFASETQQWEKSNVEGTLFVCQLAPLHPGQHVRYGVIILNRKGLDNFVTELLSGDDVDITEQYVILQVLGEDDVPTIYGLWIFSDDKDNELTSVRDIVANKIQECAVRAEHNRVQQSSDQNDESGQDAYESDSGNAPGQTVHVPQSHHQAEPQVSNQQIDLLALFGKPPTASDFHASGYEGSQKASMQQAHPGFITAPTSMQQQYVPQTQQPFPTQNTPQQNTLLSLFRSGSTG
jgi:hypothetical protein